MPEVISPSSEETFPHADHAHDLDGYHTLDLDVDLLKTLVRNLETHCGYGLGRKAVSLDMDSSKINLLDCSGLFRYLIHRCTGGKVTPPDGSQCQLAWLESEGFKQSDYASCHLEDGHVRVAVHKCDAKERIGHIAIFIDGMSWESYGGHGPGSRPASTPVLERLMNRVFVLK